VNQECNNVLDPKPLEVPTPRTSIVKIALINMEWGGKVLENPSGSAIGQVLENLGGVNGKDPCFRCNFGGDYGI